MTAFCLYAKTTGIGTVVLLDTLEYTSVTTVAQSTRPSMKGASYPRQKDPYYAALVCRSYLGILLYYKILNLVNLRLLINSLNGITIFSDSKSFFYKSQFCLNISSKNF